MQKYLCIIYLYIVFVDGTRPSEGCGNAISGNRDKLRRQRITTIDERFPTTSSYHEMERTYYYQVPAEATPDAPLPLSIYIHSWTVSANNAYSKIVQRIADHVGHFVLKPLGLSENTGFPGWDILGGNLRENCNPLLGSNTCYDSCVELNGACTRCNWIPCVDDTKFIKATIDEMLNTYCIDLDSVIMHGFSNGGMKNYEFYWEFPDLFKSVASFDGGVFPNTIPTLDSAVDYPSFWSMEQRSGFNIDHNDYLYERADVYLPKMVAASNCDENPAKIVTPADGGAQNVECFEYANCDSDTRLGYCLYDGGHEIYNWMFTLYHWFNFNEDISDVFPASGDTGIYTGYYYEYYDEGKVISSRINIKFNMEVCIFNMSTGVEHRI